MKKVDVLITGGGFIGQVAALVFANMGYGVCVVDAVGKLPAELKQDPWVWALNLRAIEILESIGLGAVLDEHAYAFDGMQVWQSSHVDRPWYFSASELMKDHLGVMMPVSPLQKAAFAAADKHASIDWQCATLVQIEEGGFYHLSNGVLIQASLVLASEGMAAAVAEHMGGEVEVLPYHQTSGVALVECAQPLLAKAYQCFYQDQIAALLPCYGANTASLVWSVPNALYQDLKAMDRKALANRLNGVFEGSELGALSLQSDIRWMPLLGHAYQKVAQDGCVLIGRSAQSLHPFLGQATCLSLIELAKLAHFVQHYQHYGHRPGDDVVLARYQRWHRSEHQAARWAINMLWHTMVSNQPIAKGARQLLHGMGLFAPIRRLAMHWAVGERSH